MTENRKYQFYNINFVTLLLFLLFEDGGWSGWSSLDDNCTCVGGSGNGTIRQSRLCNSPQPQNGGLLCQLTGNATSAFDNSTGVLREIQTNACKCMISE